MTVVPVPLPPPPIPGTVPHSPLEIRPFPIKAAEAAWDDFAGWTQSAWKSAIGWFSNAGNITGTVVEQAIDSALSRVTTAYGSAIQDVAEYALDIARNAASALADVANFELNAIYGIEDAITFLSTFVTGVVLDEIHGIEGTITDVERWVGAAIDDVIDQVRTWVIDDIASPLLREIGGVERVMSGAIEAAIDGLRDELSDLIHNETLQRLAALGAMAAAITQILEWIDTCGEPTCDLVGPKTNLSKLLKALEAAGGLAFLLALSNLTEQDLERLAAQVVAMAGGAADDFISAFFADGDELGTALADTIASVL